MKKMRKVSKITITIMFAVLVFANQAFANTGAKDEFFSKISRWEYPTVKTKDKSISFLELTKGTYTNSIFSGGVKYVRNENDFYSIRFEPDRYLTKEQEKFLIDNIDDYSTILLEDLSTDKEKIEVLVEWISKNIKYGRGGSSISPHSIYRFFDGGEGLCQVYASVFQLMAEYNGIDSVYVVGNATGGRTDGLHAWNMVKLNNKWFGVDPTWHKKGKKIIMSYNELSKERELPSEEELEEYLLNARSHRRHYFGK